MKTPRSHPFSRIILLFLIIGILYGTGCGVFTKNTNDFGASTGRIIEQYVEDMSIVGVNVLIAANNPREIFLRVAGSVKGSCTEHHETRLERAGNSITIKMTIITTIREGEGCTEEDALGFKTVDLGILPPGDYKITVNGMEQQLRVD